MNISLPIRHHFLCDMGETVTRFMIAARRRKAEGVDIVGYAEAPTEGWREGRFANLSDAAESVRRAAQEASRSAGVRPGAVWINLDDAALESVRARGGSTLEKGQEGFSPRNIQEAVQRARQSVRPSDKHLVYQGVAENLIDDENYPASPVGIFGKELTVVLQLLLSESSQAQNARLILERANLLAKPPHPSALAALNGCDIPAEAAPAFRLVVARPRVCHVIRASIGGAIQEHVSTPAEDGYDEKTRAAVAELLKKTDAGRTRVYLTGEGAEDGVLSATLGTALGQPPEIPAVRFEDKRFQAPHFSVLAGLLRLSENAMRAPAPSQSPRSTLDVVKKLKMRAQTFVQEYF